MTCQEVMDLMQRYLDKDLDNQENSALMKHLDECSNCPALFEKMKLLSNELTLLPKVVPPFSLVDSILPQLDELEDVSPAAVQGETSNHPTPVLSFGKRLTRSLSFKAISGAAAAAIILFVIFSNGIPDSFQNAGQMFEQSNNSAADTSSNADSELGNGESAIMMRSFKATEESASNDAVKNKASVTQHVMKDQSGESESEHPTGMTLEPTQDEAVETESSDGGQELMDQLAVVYRSPNGEYRAFVEQTENKRRVVIADIEGEELNSANIEENDQLVDLHWSEDSIYFEYVVTQGDKVMNIKLPVEPE